MSKLIMKNAINRTLKRNRQIYGQAKTQSSSEAKKDRKEQKKKVK